MTDPGTIITVAIRVLLHLAVVLALASLCLYVARGIYESYRGRDIPAMIRSFEVSGVSDDATKRGITLAQLLSGRLGEISKQMRAAEISWQDAKNAAPRRVTIEGRESVVTPIRLSSDVFRPLDLTMSVANVEVGKLISWLYSWFTADRALSLSAVYIGDKAVISGDLKNGDTLWVESTGKNDVEMISDVAYAIAKRPYARNYPEVEYLEAHDFGELLGSLNRIALLSLKAPVTGVAPAEYQAEYNRLEPLMRQHLPKWLPLVDLVASLAERSDKLDEALQLYKREISLLDANKDSSAIQELEKRIAALTARLAAAKPPTANITAESDAASKVRALMNVPAKAAPAKRRPRIGIVGPPPAAGVLPEGFPVTILNDAIVAEEEADHFLVDYTGHLSQAVRIVLPDVEFVYSQIKSENGSMSDAAILQAINALLMTENSVDIILHPYGAPMREPIPPAIVKSIANLKILCVFAAGNEGSKKDGAGKIFSDKSPFRPGADLRKYVAVAAAVDLTGKPTRFTQQDAEVLWAPGAEVSEWQGTSLAAALTAGAAAWLKAQRPDLGPAEIVRILQETSSAKIDPRTKIIDVTAALAKMPAP